jgi:hypothetical protein
MDKRTFKVMIYFLNNFRDLTNAAALITKNELEKNFLLISHNPIMTLGLFIQYLHQVKNGNI